MPGTSLISSRCRVATDTAQRATDATRAVEARDVEVELTGGVELEVALREALLAGEQHVVHLPEAVLVGGCSGRHCSGERVRVDLHQRVVPERDANLS